MKVILLAGGFGTRISEYTKMIPKPMIDIGGKPMILYIVGQSFNILLTLAVVWLMLSGNFFPVPELGG